MRMTMLRFSLTNGAFHPFPKTLSRTVQIHLEKEELVMEARQLQTQV